jgi:amino acid permease
MASEKKEFIVRDSETGTDARSKQIAGQTESTVNMINIAIGAGVLSFPFGFQLGGYVWTLVMIACTAALACYTLVILMRGCNFYDADSYQSLIRKAGGVKMEIFAVLWMIALQFGACTAYLIIIFDTMNPVIEYWGGASSDLTSREFIIPMFACVFIFPLCCLRSLKALAPASMVAVFCVSFASFTIVYRGFETLVEKGVGEGCCDLQDYPDDAASGQDCDWIEDNKNECGCCHDESLGDERVNAFGKGVDFISPIGIVVFALLSHIQAPSVFAELADPLHGDKGSSDKGDTLSSTGVPLLQHPDGSTPSDEYEQSKLRREALMKKIIATAMSVITTFYVVVGGFGYFQFGEDVQSNVLNSYGNDDNFVNVARLCICCLVSVSYPILHYVARSMIDDLTSSAENQGTEMSNLKHFGLTISFVGLTIVLAINLDDLGIVVDIIGSTAGVLAMFVLPGYILMVPNGPYSTGARSADDDIFPVEKNGHFYAGVALQVGGLVVMIISLLDTFDVI